MTRGATADVVEGFDVVGKLDCLQVLLEMGDGVSGEVRSLLANAASQKGHLACKRFIQVFVFWDVRQLPSISMPHRVGGLINHGQT